MSGPMPGASEWRVCLSCAGNDRLCETLPSAEAECKYCKKVASATFAFTELVDEARGRLRDLVIDVPPGRPIFLAGKTVAEVVSNNLLGATDFHAELVSALCDPHAPQAFARERLYRWHYQRDDPAEIDKAWHEFQATVRSGSRFFNQKAKHFLDDLFEALPRLKTNGFFETEPVVTIPKGRRLVRARLANTREQLETIVGDLASQLDAPPPARAPANRMNVAQMPAFYAAFDENTAIAETRPSIESDVVVAQFEVTRPMRVLDLELLARSEGATYSIWSRAFRRRAVMRALLKRLHQRISRPVRPGEEHEYIDTQVVADYLFTHQSLDGLVYLSSQVATDAKNVVIFSGALGEYRDGKFAASPVRFVENSAKRHRVVKVDIKAPGQGYLLPREDD